MMSRMSPTRKLSRFSQFIVSSRVITAGIAIAATPLVANLAARVQGRFGAIPGGTTGALIVVAFIIFVIAGMFGGLISDVLLGVAISAFVNAVLTIPRVARTVGTLTAARSG